MSGRINGGEMLAIDRDEIRTALSVLVDPDHSFEIRALPSARSRVFSGASFDDAIRFVEQCQDDNGTYLTINPVDRSHRRPACDENIVSRRWLFIDIDAVRASVDTSATEAEKEVCLEVARDVIEYLAGRGWHHPGLIDSGNGYHLYFRVDLPNDAGSREVIANVLAELGKRFDRPGAAIDRVVANASRIAKLPGTIARKGKDEPDRPHRVSHFLVNPEELPIITMEQLGAIVNTTPDEPEGVDTWKLKVSDREGLENYVETAIERECSNVVNAIPGPAQGRNNQLNISALALGTMAGWPEMDSNAAKQRLMAAAIQSGLDEGPSRKTIESGWRKGVTCPRDRESKLAEGREGTFATFATFATRSVSPETDPREWSLEEWEDPEIRELPDVEPFPLDVLPESLADLCRYASQNMHCPSDYFAVCSLGMAGTAIGQTVNLRLTESWKVSTNLYLAIVGPPGTKKSPAIGMMAKPLFDIDRCLRERYLADLDLHKERVRVLGKGDAMPSPPIPKHLTLDDITREAVAQVHSENPRGLSVILDELAAWITSLDAYRAGKGGDSQFWLKINSGSLVKVTRKGSREPIVIPRPCISIIGGLTPSSVPMMTNSGRDDGWLDRILFCFPEPFSVERTWGKVAIPELLKKDWDAAIRMMWERPMYLDEETGRERPYFVNLDPDAEATWADFFNAHWKEAAATDFPPSLIGPWSKIELFTARTALILSQLHAVYQGVTPDSAPQDVDATAMRGAVKLAAYFKSHFKKARACLRGDERPEAAAFILRWLEESRPSEIVTRDLTRAYAKKFDSSVIRDSLSYLERCKVLHKSKADKSTGGRPKSASYVVNPKLYTPVAKVAKVAKVGFESLEGGFE